jgi:hypothetical protein
MVEHHVRRRRRAGRDTRVSDDGRITVDWLALREPADAAARAADLVAMVAGRLPADGPIVVHDLGCGSGGMGRWLAPQLPGPQRWVLHDRDPELLAAAAVELPGAAADGAPVAVETRQSDVTRLGPDGLAGATLLTASALLDLLTAADLSGLVDACAGAGCPSLLTLSVVGRVELSPPDPLDARVAAAFNAHQRRVTEHGRLLGPDAVDAAAELFADHGLDVVVRPSPWRLGKAETGLASAWFAGWFGAAREQEPALAEDTAGYAARRRTEAAAGRLAVTVDHADLLAVPR